MPGRGGSEDAPGDEGDGHDAPHAGARPEQRALPERDGQVRSDHERGGRAHHEGELDLRGEDARVDVVLTQLLEPPGPGEEPGGEIGEDHRHAENDDDDGGAPARTQDERPSIDRVGHERNDRDSGKGSSGAAVPVEPAVGGEELVDGVSPDLPHVALPPGTLVAAQLPVAEERADRLRTGTECFGGLHDREVVHLFERYRRFGPDTWQMGIFPSPAPVAPAGRRRRGVVTVGGADDGRSLTQPRKGAPDGTSVDLGGLRPVSRRAWLGVGCGGHPAGRDGLRGGRRQRGRERAGRERAGRLMGLLFLGSWLPLSTSADTNCWVALRDVVGISRRRRGMRCSRSRRARG